MAVSHISLNLLSWNKSSHRVNYNDINRSGAHHGLCDLKRLISAVRLGNIQFININADIFRINRIQCMLCINKPGNSASFLYFRNHVESHRRLTAGFRPVNLNHTTFRNPSESQRKIQAQTARGNSLNRNMRTGISKPHHRAFSEILFQLGDRRIQRFFLFFVHICTICHKSILLFKIEQLFASVTIVLYRSSNVNNFFDMLPL